MELLEGEAALAAKRPIGRAIDRFNDGASGLSAPAEFLALPVRDAAGAIAGGLWGISYYGWLFVELLVVPDAQRGQGLGTRLMAEAERVARARGCIGIWLDTFSFQARPFYEKLGFTLFGELADYPPGGSRFWLRKRL